MVDDEELFRKEIDIKIDHYCGIHDNCHADMKKSCRKVNPINDGDAKKAFMVSIILYY